jgi:hypothetical protein
MDFQFLLVGKLGDSVHKLGSATLTLWTVITIRVVP